MNPAKKKQTEKRKKFMNSITSLLCCLLCSIDEIGGFWARDLLLSPSLGQVKTKGRQTLFRSPITRASIFPSIERYRALNTPRQAWRPLPPPTVRQLARPHQRPGLDLASASLL